MPGRVPIVCPRCRSEGWAPIEQLTRLRCKRCNARFYIDQGGRLMLGTPPADQPSAPRVRVATRLAHADLMKPLARIPRPAWMAAGAIVLVLGLYLGLQALYGGGPPIPETLEQRARYVATALLEGDRSAVGSIAVDGTGRDASKWFDAIRPASWRVRPPEGADLEVDVLYSNQKSGDACTVVTVTFPSPSDDGAKGPTGDPDGGAKVKPARSLELLLYWKLDGRGAWLLDGSRNLEEST